ncbi:MAG: hypothetical protein ACLGH0_05840, partial [Thermoanaerobaculia bacterium]
MTTRDELLAKLREPEGYAELLRLAAETPRAKLLRRCASVSGFERYLYEKVLAGDGEFSFEDVITWPEIELVPGMDEQYRVRNRASVAEEDPALHGRLADYFAALGPAAAPRTLYHLLRVDVERALASFIALFDAAEAAFDLPRCQELLAFVKERETYLPPVFQNALDERSARFQARMLWSDEYYRSMLYLARPAQMTAFEDFLRGNAWIANVFAEGGMGKTAAIRWLIARHAVPARIPVARVDFDFVDAYTATTNPIWMLLEIVKQLDPQLGGQLERIRSEFAEYATRLEGTGSAIGGFTKDAIDSFCERLSELRPGRPTLLIFDTVEIAVVHEGVDFDPLLTLLKEIHAGVPSVRVILSGRYDLRQRLPAFQA